LPVAVKPGQYVYVVCSTGNDYFAEMTAVSMATLRMASQHARIAVLTDRETSLIESPAMSAIRAAANELTIVDCPGDSSIIRSRFLKTGMRQLVSGRFTFLDSDTIIMRSPDAIWSIDCDVGASPDLAPSGKPYLCSSALPETCAALGWTLGSGLYLNAGFIYFADSEAALAFGEQYRLSWLEFQRLTGHANDQLAFNHAVNVVGPRLAVLPSSYNAQISMNVMTIRGAMIAHYFTGKFESRDDTIAHTTAKRLKSEGVLDIALLRSAITNGNPWTRIDSYRKAVAAHCYLKVGGVAFNRLLRIRRRNSGVK
jgi:hypothetical protein